jgi:hypothetical protein
MESPVYINWGRFVADCPAPGCGDAREVEPGQKTMTCCVGENCPGHTSDLGWPTGVPQVMAALQERISEKRRNWFPDGHPFAVAAGLPHGQSVAELRQETERGEAEDADMLARRRSELLGQMKKLGVTPEEALNVLKGS